MPTLNIRAHWDAEARVWWAESREIPGLVAETTTYDALVAELRNIVPALMAMNMPEVRDGVSLRITSDQVEDVLFA